MHIDELKEIAARLVSPGKGILAADESNTTADKRLAVINVEGTEENRRLYRQLFFHAPNIENYLSGVIFYDETLYQKDDNGVLFVDLLKEKGIITGIKVDEGLVDLTNFPNEKVSRGLDNLAPRLRKYHELGARFAKWRSLITITDELPTDECIDANAYVLAQYAALCQEAGIVPVIEPEVLLDGSHTIERSEVVTTKVLKSVFSALEKYKVDLEGVILKSSMVISGKDCSVQATDTQVAEATVRVFNNSVPHAIPGIVFLSGGQTPAQATDNLNAIGLIGEQPWALTFSYARALQGPALLAWAGESDNVRLAQEVFEKRLAETSAARDGQYQKS